MTGSGETHVMAEDSMKLENKVALVTGGGTGIGKATSLLLASEGCDVVVNYSRSEADANDTCAEIEKLGRKAISVQADISDQQAVSAMFEAVDQQFGRVDILVNNAATTQFVAYTDLDGMTDEIWDRVFAVNVKGVFYCCREAIKRMKSRGRGTIVSVSSIAGMTGLGSSIAYAASKAALINMTRALAASCAPEISVNAVAPGVVETRWIEGWEKFTDPHRDATPMKRHARPEDVANAIFGLILCPFTTGETIRVDGGRTLGTT